MFKNRNELQEALFECSYCNSKEEEPCLIRNEDMLGSYDAKVWIVGINPHCTEEEVECFQQGKISLEEWKDRARNYFTKKEKKDFCGQPQKKDYTHFTQINKKLNLKIKFWEEDKISYVDYYKLGTKDEAILKDKIRKNPRIQECPDKYFANQLLIKTPDLLIITGRELRKGFYRKWKDNFSISVNCNIWKEGISEIEIKEVEWYIEAVNKNIKVVFCMSFSSQNNRRWKKEQLNELNRIITKHLK